MAFGSFSKSNVFFHFTSHIWLYGLKIACALSCILQCKASCYSRWRFQWFFCKQFALYDLRYLQHGLWKHNFLSFIKNEHRNWRFILFYKSNDLVSNDLFQTVFCLPQLKSSRFHCAIKHVLGQNYKTVNFISHKISYHESWTVKVWIEDKKLTGFVT